MAQTLRSHSIFHHTGGLAYHLRALRYRRNLWQPFMAIAADWLAAWQPPRQQLLIVGPSAGYSLSADFLARFAAAGEAVIAMEPDPLARWILRYRFPSVRWQFDSLDVFQKGGLRALAHHYPHACILFANVIGQKLESDPRFAQTWRAQLREQLAGHHWASYHDVISTEATPLANRATLHVAPDDRRDRLEDVLAKFWPPGELPLVDHHCWQLQGEGHGAAYALWSITPQQHHLIEWQSHTPI